MRLSLIAPCIVALIALGCGKDYPEADAAVGASTLFERSDSYNTSTDQRWVGQSAPKNVLPRAWSQIRRCVAFPAE